MITSVDINNSLLRLQATLEGDYGNFPIYEDKRRVGKLTLDKKNKRVFVTYRGSVNSLFEIFSCLLVWKKPWDKRGGGVHAGLYNAFQKTQKSFQSALQEMVRKNNISLDPFNFLIEGYSRGSGLAILTALFLKQQYPRCNINVLTYSTMKLFDQNAAENYQKTMQGHHWSFLCTDDSFPKWIGPSFLGFCPVGNKIEFPARESENYKRRTAANQYSYLAEIPIVSYLFKKLISSATWEAHMPTIYNELAAGAYLRGNSSHSS
jgi:hypothetical protein